MEKFLNFLDFAKGQLISKANCQAMNSSKKNEFVFTAMQCVFVPFLDEIEDTKKSFRNYLTFSPQTFLIRYVAFCHTPLQWKQWKTNQIKKSGPHFSQYINEVNFLVKMLQASDKGFFKIH